MAVDLSTDPDTRFFSDNFLSKEDWDGLFDLEANLTEDLMPPLSSDVDLPLLDGHGLDLDFSTSTFSTDMGDPWNDMGESSDSGISSVSVKQEPLSPASSHCSDSSADSLITHTGIQVEPLIDFPMLETDIKLESSILTPPREANDILGPPPSKCTKLAFTLPKDSKDNIIVTLPHNGVLAPKLNGSTVVNPVTLVPSNVLTAHNVKTTNGVVNSKVKIQPRPIAVAPPPKAASALPPTVPGKPLVLTAEEFAKLTSQGVLKFHPPTKTDTKLTTTTPAVVAPPKPTSPIAPIIAANPTLLLNDNNDNKAVKRQQRMIKNRESACLSRKRKKEYMTGLEGQLQEYSKENDRLKQENELLIQKVQQLQVEENEQLLQKVQLLQVENERLKKTSGIGSNKRTATFLLAAVFMFGLNLGPLSGIFLSSSKNHLNSFTSPVHRASGRNLLAVPDEQFPRGHFNANVRMLQDTVGQLQKSLEISASMGQVDRKDLMLLKDLESLGTFCPTYLNSTESLRLANDLAGWVHRHKEEHRLNTEKVNSKLHGAAGQSRENSAKPRRKTRKQYLPPRKLKAALRGQVDLKYTAGSSSESKYQVQLFQGPDSSYGDFLRDIHRRNDTFYVVSFKRDHLLLPATAHNKTMRPRMSLVMPALTLNESLQAPAGSVAMMQIDCQVMDTKLVHIRETAIPSFLKENSTTQQQSVMHPGGATFP